MLESWWDRMSARLDGIDPAAILTQREAHG
jgi:hypothetical protein